MKKAYINSYGDSSRFEFSELILNTPLSSNDIKISVKATSVNPIDVMKREGYGKSIFEKQRNNLLGSE